MNVYLIEATCCYGENYTVVAESYAEAERLWKKEYPYSNPKGIKVFSNRVILENK